MAPGPSGKAKVCNTSIPGPIPGGASKMNNTPNLNHNSSIGVLFVFKNLYRKRLFTPFLIFCNRTANSGMSQILCEI